MAAGSDGVVSLGKTQTLHSANPKTALLVAA